jgi:hypothetical protein
LSTTDISIRILVTGVEDITINMSVPSEGFLSGQVAIPASGKKRIPLANIPAEDMRILVIESTRYTDVVYSVLDGVGQSYELDNAAIFLGAKMFEFFDSVPNQLWIYNNGSTEITINTLFVFDSVEESSMSSESSLSSESSTSSESSSSTI